MKKIEKILIIAISLVSLVSITNNCNSQEKFDVSTGFGIFELVNIGARYQPTEKAQFGLKVGTFPSKNEKLISISGDVYYHFAGVSKLSNQPPWYGKLGLDYLRDETKSVIDKYLFLTIRIGRDINFTNRLGMKLDAGLDLELDHKQTHKLPSDWNINIDIPVLPTGGIELFYRL